MDDHVASVEHLQPAAAMSAATAAACAAAAAAEIAAARVELHFWPYRN